MKNIFIVIIFFNYFAKAQNIEIINSQGKVLNNVLIYSGGKYLGVISETGNFNLSNKNLLNSDTIIFIKNNYETKKILYSDVKTNIVLDSIRYKEIEEVTITKRNDEELLKNIKNNLNNSTYSMFEGNKVYWQTLNSLVVNGKKIIYYNDIFLYKKNDGFYTGGLTNFVKNLDVIDVPNGTYTQRYQLYDKKYIFKDYYVVYPHVLQRDEYLIDILENSKKYNLKFKNIGDNKYIIYVSKDNFIATLVVDVEKFGIYTFKYEKKNFNENSANYKGQKVQKYSVSIKKGEYNYKIIENHFVNSSVSFYINFKNLQDNAEFIYQFKKNNIVPLELKNLKKINIITLEYEN